MIAPTSMFLKNMVRRGELTSLPSGWTIEKLTRIAERGSGHTPSKSHPEYWDGRVKWISLKDSDKLDQVFIGETAETISALGIENSSACIHPAGVVVLCRDAGVGKCAVTTSPMAVSQHFVVWNCGPTLQNIFLYYQLLGMRSEFERIATGSTIVTIGLGYFDQMEVLLPPYDEQVRIAEVLQLADKAIKIAERRLGAAKNLQRAHLQRLLRGPPKKRVAQGAWSDVQFGDVFEKKQERNTALRVRTAITVGKYAITRQSDKYTKSVTSADVSNYWVIRPGDFVYDPMSAYYGAIGRYDLGEPGIVSPAYRVQTLKPGFDSDFIKYVLKTHYVRHQLEAYSSQNNQTGKRRLLQRDAFESVSFRCPSLGEQRRVAAVLVEGDREIELLTAQLLARRRQRKGLMRQLLTGVLRVPKNAARRAS